MNLNTTFDSNAIYQLAQIKEPKIRLNRRANERKLTQKIQRVLDQAMEQMARKSVQQANSKAVDLVLSSEELKKADRLLRLFIESKKKLTAYAPTVESVQQRIQEAIKTNVSITHQVKKRLIQGYRLIPLQVEADSVSQKGYEQWCAFTRLAIDLGIEASVIETAHLTSSGRDTLIHRMSEALLQSEVHPGNDTDGCEILLGIIYDSLVANAEWPLRALSLSEEWKELGNAHGLSIADGVRAWLSASTNTLRKGDYVRILDNSDGVSIEKFGVLEDLHNDGIELRMRYGTSSIPHKSYVEPRRMNLSNVQKQYRNLLNSVKRTAMSDEELKAYQKQVEGLDLSCVGSDGVEVRCHRKAYASASPACRLMIEAHWKESIEGVVKMPAKGGVVKAFLDHLYGLPTSIATVEDYRDLFEMARMWDIPSLRQVATRELIDHRRELADADVQILIDTYNLPIL